MKPSKLKSINKNNIPRIALIFQEYDAPMRPYFKRITENIISSEKFFFQIFSTNRGNPSNIIYIGGLNRFEKINRIFEIMFTAKWYYKKKLFLLLVNKVELNHFIRYWPVYKLHPDIVHVNIPYLFSKLLPVMKELGVKSIFSFHGRDINVLPLIEKSWKIELLKIFDFADALHFVSEAMKNEAIKLGAKNNKCLTIYQSTNLPYKNKIKHNNNRILNIVSIGSMKWEKGYPISLMAINKLLQKKYKLHYTIIGNGYLLPQLEFMRKDLFL